MPRTTLMAASVAKRRVPVLRCCATPVRRQRSAFDRGHIVSSLIEAIKLTQEDAERLHSSVLARPTCSAGTVAHMRRALSVALHTAVGRGRLAQPGQTGPNADPGRRRG